MLYSLKEVSERPFSADRIADQQREKIDGFIRSEAPAHQAHQMGKDFKLPLRRQVTGNHDVIAQTTQAPKDDQEVRFGPRYRDWVS